MMRARWSAKWRQSGQAYHQQLVTLADGGRQIRDAVLRLAAGCLLYGELGGKDLQETTPLVSEVGVLHVAVPSSCTLKSASVSPAGPRDVNRLHRWTA